MNQSYWKSQLVNKVCVVYFMEPNIEHQMQILLLHFLACMSTMFPVLLATLLYEEARSWSQALLPVHLHGPGSTMATSWQSVLPTIDQLMSVWMWMLSQSLEVKHEHKELSSTSLKYVTVLVSTALHTPVVTS